MGKTTNPESIAIRWTLIDGSVVLADETDKAHEAGMDAAGVRQGVAELLCGGDDATFAVDQVGGALCVLPSRSVLRVEVLSGHAARSAIIYGS